MPLRSDARVTSRSRRSSVLPVRIVSRSLVDAMRVHHFLEAGPLQQGGVIGRIVGHHDHGRAEVIDQQAAFFVGGETGGTANGLRPARANPVGGFVQQPAGDGRVVNRLKQAEEADVLVLIAIVFVVDESGDRADHPPEAPGREVFAIHIFPGGVLGFVPAIDGASKAAAAPNWRHRRNAARGSRRNLQIRAGLPAPESPAPSRLCRVNFA